MKVLERSILGAALAGSLLSFAAMPPAVAQATVVGILPFAYLDTSGEPRDQTAEHDARVKAMAAQLRSEIAAGAAVTTVEVPAAAACAAGDSDCILDAARAAGAGYVVAGALQKASTMETQFWIGVFDTATGKMVFHRNMSFRGDTDDAWRRATTFLARQIATKGLTAG